MCVPRRGWQSLIRDDSLRGEAGSCLSEMIHFGRADVTCTVSDLSIANFHQRRSNMLVAISPLPILIKDDPAPWWQNLPLCEWLQPCAGGRPFVSSWLGLKVDRTTCMPFEQIILLYETQPWCSSINIPSLLNQWKFIFCSSDFCLPSLRIWP